MTCEHCGSAMRLGTQKYFVFEAGEADDFLSKKPPTSQPITVKNVPAWFCRCYDEPVVQSAVRVRAMTIMNDVSPVGMPQVWLYDYQKQVP